MDKDLLITASLLKFNRQKNLIYWLKDFTIQLG